MLKVRQYSITSKLTKMNMLVSGAALLLACAAFVGYDLISFRNAMVHNLVDPGADRWFQFSVRAWCSVIRKLRKVHCRRFKLPRTLFPLGLYAGWPAFCLILSRWRKTSILPA